MFEQIKELSNVIEKVKSTEESEFSKFIKSKMELFVRGLTNIYTEIMIEHNKQVEKLVNFYKQLLESSNTE